MKKNVIEKRLSLVCYLIDSKPNEKYSLQELSDVARISKYHFQRVFKSMVGVTPHRYILLSRLRRASFELVYFKELKIIDIALSAGFESPEAFTRAFVRLFDQTPTEFRKKPQWSSWGHRFNIRVPVREKKYEIKVEEYPSRECVMITHKGDYLEGMKTFDTLVSWLVENNFYSETSIKSIPFITIPYANPLESDRSDYRCDIAIAINCKVLPNDLGIFSGTISRGDFAVVTYVGQREVYGFVHAITNVLTEWLPKTQWEPLSAPILFEHINSPLVVPETDLITKICIPVCRTINP
ncbi:AraC family transcriptional regulator [Photobacterium angustum]|uniref:AraC family transcriptional regulator n=1 Tax=Photobacterium angustum TaxID=661 RepID=A0ABX5GZ94_PHOAN|nr:helix-turn-helix domain-containing protein [Photobacterium angustum]KJG35401.1 AraC family transcriptional regulator [Photobacterium angustum]PSX05207.1 AraC family transcriptional regulator [Photobacterium angustum]